MSHAMSYREPAPRPVKPREPTIHEEWEETAASIFLEKERSVRRQLARGLLVGLFLALSAFTLFAPTTDSLVDRLEGASYGLTFAVGTVYLVVSNRVRARRALARAAERQRAMHAYRCAHEPVRVATEPVVPQTYVSMETWDPPSAVFRLRADDCRATR